MESSDDDPVALQDLALTKIRFGEDLLNTLSNFKYIEGFNKLRKKIEQELRFLRKECKSSSIKKEHLQCSNLTHLSAVIDTLKTIKNCQSLNKVFTFDDRKIAVDMVCEGGLLWMKIIARNPKSLSDICMGIGSYGVRSIIDQAEEFLTCAQVYPCMFQTPKVKFVFTKGISSKVACRLENLGITVEGERVDDFLIESQLSSNSDLSDSEEEIRSPPSVTDLSTKNVFHLNRVNLDVSAMLAYCSSVTNGSANILDFHVPVLKQQAEWERQRPQKPILDNFFKDKKLYCCQTAKDNFVNILETVGGPSESARALELLERVTVLPDDADFTAILDPDTSSHMFEKVQYRDEIILKIGGKIKKRSLVIFTFGDRIHAVTVSANDGFVRAAKQQGINFVVFIHESRALTENKEKLNATPIEN